MFLNNILDITWKGADNANVWDTTGKSYVDFTCGIFATNIGHANPEVTEAICRGAGVLHTYTFKSEIREAIYYGKTLDLRDAPTFTDYEDRLILVSRYSPSDMRGSGIKIIDDRTLLVANDNNYPMSTGRRPPDTPDDNQVILLRLSGSLAGGD